MSAVIEFNGCVGDVDTEDLTAKEFFFTWSSRGGCMGDSKSKIDRAMVNHNWQNCFPKSESVFASSGVLLL